MTQRKKAKRAKSKGVHCHLMDISVEDRLASVQLARLRHNLIARLSESGLKKPEFAAFIGMSGSQFRYVRSGVANPSLQMLSTISNRLETPLYELLEEKKLGRKKDLTAAEMAQNLGTYLKKDWEKSGLTKEDYGKIIGVSLPQLYVLLRGNANPSWLVIVEIARRLEMSVWRLLGVSGS